MRDVILRVCVMGGHTGDVPSALTCCAAPLAVLDQGFLEEYNAAKWGPHRMELVMFMHCIEHVSRIARVLRQPR